jgi:DNA-binding LacI/PurR family transcriptional regulator
MQFDNAAAVRIGVEHLASLGHRRIGYVGSCKAQVHRDTLERKFSFIDSIAAMGLDADQNLVFDSNLLGRTILPDEECCMVEGEGAAMHFANMGNNRPTAILAYNDLSAIACMNQFLSMGIQTPGDISIMGIDDGEICKRVFPKLTSISHPLPEMGYAAAKFLIKRSAPEHRGTHGKETLRQVFGPTLMPRQSTVVIEQEG